MYISLKQNLFLNFIISTKNLFYINNKILILILLFISITTLNAQNLEKIKVQLQWKHQFEFAGFYAAKEKGFYKEAGLDVELVEYDENKNIINEVLSGNAQYGTTYSNLVAEYLNGKPLVFVANYFKESPLILITQKEIKTPKDLIDKKVMGIDSAFENVLMSSIFDKFNIKRENFINIPHSFDLNDFIDNKIDALVVYKTNETYALDKVSKKYNVFNPTVYGSAYYDLNLFTSQKELLNNPQRVKAFKEATKKGWEYALSNKMELVDLILKKYNSQNKEKEALEYEAKKISRIILPSLYEIGSINKNRVKEIADSFLELEIIKNKTNMSLEQFIFEDKNELIKLTKEEKDFIKKHPLITLAGGASFEPFLIKERNGKITGLDRDYANIIEKRTGLKINFELGTWSNMVNKAKERKYDGLSTSFIDKERAKYFNFSSSYFRYSALVMVKKGNPEKINTLKDLKDKTIALQKGNKIFDTFSKELKNSKIIYYDSIHDLLRAVVSGEADFTILDETAYYIAREIGLSNLIEHTFVIGETVDVIFSLRNDWPELQSIFNKAIKTISKKEKIEILDKWIKDIEVTDEKKSLLSEAEILHLNKLKNIKMCIDPNWYPFEKNEKGKHVGISADFFNIFKNNINIPIELVNTKTWEDSINFAKNRNCDILSLSMETPRKKEYMNFTKSYVETPLVLATRPEEQFIEDLSLLKNQKIAIVKGYAFNEILKYKYSNFQIIDVENIDDGLQKVANKEVYGFIGALASISYKFQTKFVGELKISGKFDEKWKLGIAVRNDDPILLNIFNKLIENLSSENKKKILNSYIAIKYDKNKDYSLLLKVIAVFLLIFLFIIYLNRNLKKEKLIVDKLLKTLQIRDKELTQKNDLLEKLSVTDKLTGLYNRFKIDYIIKEELLRSERTEHAFSIIMIDIDFFKNVNDTYGHLTGDAVLIGISSILKKNIRRTDILGRWGGEEFLMICPYTKGEGILTKAQRVREEIQNHKFKVVGTKTASFGISTYKKGDTLESIIARADEALYEAKQTGRNKVVVKN